MPMESTAVKSEALQCDSPIANRSLSLIGAATSLGCPKGGCELGPFHLQQIGLDESLALSGINSEWLQVVQSQQKKPVLEAVAAHSQQLADCVAGQLLKQQFFAVVGGDHSCAIGTWNGVSQAHQGNPFGMIWVDAHMDSHTPHSSHSGAIHGMPLACLLGFGEPELTQLTSTTVDVNSPVIQPEHLCLIGVRSYEPEESELLENLGVRIFDMAEIERRGMPAVIRDAILIASDAGDFGVSIDLDAIDPQLAPGVSTPEPGGLAINHLNELLKPLPTTPGLIGIEIAEFNPRFDQNHQTARLISTILAACVPETNEKE